MSVIYSKREELMLRYCQKKFYMNGLSKLPKTLFKPIPPRNENDMLSVAGPIILFLR